MRTAASGLTLLLSLTLFAVSTGRTAFHMAVLGDRTGQADQVVFERIISEICLLNPDACINVGDLIEGPQPDAESIHREWDIVLNTIKKMDMPIYFVPGNNDIFNDESRKIYTERTLRKPYYSFDLSGAHFIVLDNSDADSYEEMTREQWEWFENDLKTHQEQHPILVFLHKPFWFDSFIREKPDRLHELCVEYHVDWVFSGHYHQYTSTVRDGVHYVMIGSSGGHCDPAEGTGRFYNFGWLTIQDRSVSLAIIRSPSVFPENYIPLERVIATDRLERDLLTFDMQTPVTSGKSYQGRVKLNPVIDQPVRIGYNWKSDPDVWAVDPSSGEIDAGKTPSVIEFRAVNSGTSVYPLPRINLRIPMPDGLPFEMSQPFQIRRNIDVPRLKDRSNPDGHLDEAAWKKSAHITDFGSLEGENSENMQCHVHIFFAKDAMMIGAVCDKSEHGGDEIPEIERDGPVFQYDYLMFSIQPDMEDAGFYRLFINRKGSILDLKSVPNDASNKGVSFDKSWNGNYLTGISETEDLWTLELGIPYEELSMKVPDRKSRIGLNILQYNSQAGEMSVWQAPFGNSPENFGRLTTK